MKNKFPENKKLSIKYRCKEDGGVYSAEQASNMPNNHFRLITEKGKEIGEFVKWSDETN